MTKIVATRTSAGHPAVHAGAGRPAQGILQRKCDCGTYSSGGASCSRCARQRNKLQRRAAIGPADDAYEREAERVADQIVKLGDTPASALHAAPASSLDPIAAIARFASQAGPGPASSPASVDRVLASAGQPLAAALRQDMERHFRHDFSGVRVHTGVDAAQSARDIGASAYTSGPHIAFADGRFAPGTHAGRRLLAHELTHVVQQSGQRQGQPAPTAVPTAAAAAAPLIQRDSAGGGSTTFKDTPQLSPKKDGGVVEGSVLREETAPAAGGKPAEIIHTGSMRVRFNPANCALTIPAAYQFERDDNAATSGTCDDPAPAIQVPKLANDAFARLKAGVLADLNSGLNGWFKVRLAGPGCPGGCSDKALPIQVEASEANGNADVRVSVVNRGGRADSGTICARSWDSSTAIHEGGHQVLGLGDEYPETDAGRRALAPETYRPERVRRDYSLMGPEEHSRFAMFQQRHFSAVTTFMEAAFPNCKATLEASARPILPNFRFSGGAGVAKLGGGTGMYFNLGLGMGIPLDRLRRWELVLGPQFTLMDATGGADLTAFLLGARLGLQGSSGAAGSGFSAGAFAEAGRGWFSGAGSFKSAYGEAGVKAGYRSSLDTKPSFRFTVGVESALGSSLGAAGGMPAAVGNDTGRVQWFRLGLSVGGEF